MAVQAALDIGSNSVKLLVLHIEGDGAYHILWDQSTVTGLGQGVSKTGLLDSRAVERTIQCLEGMVAKARSLESASIRAAGTAALRNAKNSRDFVAKVEAGLGVDIEILTGEQEAELSRAVALRELDSGAADVVFFDVGGGSTELTWCRGEEVRAQASLELGARRLTELAGLIHPVLPSMRERLDAVIEMELQYNAPVVRQGDAPGAAAAPAVQLAGLGGTATTLVWLIGGMHGGGIANPHGARIKGEDIAAVLAALAGMTIREVKGRPNLDPARADVIFAGTVIIHKLLEHYRAEEFTLVDRGLRFGLLLA